MAKLLMSRKEVRRAIAGRVRVGDDLAVKAECAENTGWYEAWLAIVATWPEVPHGERRKL